MNEGLFTVSRYIPKEKESKEEIKKKHKKKEKKSKTKEGNENPCLDLKRETGDSIVKGDKKNKENEQSTKKKQKTSNEVNNNNDLQTEDNYSMGSVLNIHQLGMNEKTWLNNLIKKTKGKDLWDSVEGKKIKLKLGYESKSESESDSDDEEYIINVDNIFKNIYPFFKSEENPTYLEEQREIKKYIKNNS